MNDERLKILPLDRIYLDQHIEELIGIDRESFPTGSWRDEHFQAELPGKWDCSFAALNNGILVGFAICSLKQDSLHLHRIAVLHACRSQGIGSLLLTSMNEAARRHERKQVTLAVHHLNSKGINFYKNQGFQKIAENGADLILSSTVSAREIPKNPPKNFVTSKGLLRFGKLSFTFAIILLIALKIDLTQVFTSFLSVNPSFFLLANIVMMVNMFLGAKRWRVLITSKKADAPTSTILRILMVAHFFNTLVPGSVAGDAVRGLEGRKFGLSGANSFGIIIFDRLIGFAGMLAIGSLGLVVRFEKINDSGFLEYFLIAGGLLAMGLAALNSRRFLKLIERILNRFGGIFSRISRIFSALREFRLYPKLIVGTFFLSILNILCLVGINYLLSLSLGLNINFTEILLFIPIISVISMIPLSVGGIGIREASYVTLFPLVGLPAAQALSLSLLFFSLIVTWALFGGAIHLSYSALQNYKSARHKKIVPSIQ